MKKNRVFSFAFIISAIVFSSCSQKIYTKYNLFQKGLDSLSNFEYKAPVIQNSDGLAILVFSATLSQDQVAVFNMGGSSGGSSSASSGSNEGNSAGGTVSGASESGVTYKVDLDGNIVMPILGTIKARGLTIAELTKLVTNKLEIYIKDPIVKINFTGIKVNVLGEVKIPGTKVFTTNTPTILDALAQSGDFTDGAQREEIYLVRDSNGKRTTYKINMNNASVFNSEVYQLAQNDLVYVPANIIKLKTVNQDPDFQKKVQLFTITISALTSLSVILNAILILKKL